MYPLNIKKKLKTCFYLVIQIIVKFSAYFNRAISGKNESSGDQSKKSRKLGQGKSTKHLDPIITSSTACFPRD